MIKSIRVLQNLNLWDMVKITNPRADSVVTGRVVKIFQANLPKDPKEVKRFFEVDEHSKAWRFFNLPFKMDYIVVEKDSGGYYSFPRNPLMIINWDIRLRKLGRAPVSLVKLETRLKGVIKPGHLAVKLHPALYNRLGYPTTIAGLKPDLDQRVSLKHVVLWPPC